MTLPQRPTVHRDRTFEIQGHLFRFSPHLRTSHGGAEVIGGWEVCRWTELGWVVVTALPFRTQRDAMQQMLGHGDIETWLKSQRGE